MYYTLKYRSIVDFGEQVIPNANASNVPGGKEYFYRMFNQELIDDAPVFDYFHLETMDRTKPETWEWMLQDIHAFFGGENPAVGWLISDHFKQVLEQFVIAEPYRFYPAKLKYQSRKLDYFIFNLLWIKLETILVFEDLKFRLIDASTGELKGKYAEAIHSKEELGNIQFDLRRRQGLNMELDEITLTRYFDFVPLYGINADIIISERLKKAIEQSKIEGVIIEEAPYKIRMPELKEQ